MIHLRLLSTPPRGDAVTFGYRPESTCLEGTCTPLIEYTLRRTRAGYPPRGAKKAGRTRPPLAMPQSVGTPVQRSRLIPSCRADSIRVKQPVGTIG
jgi:hypothetical protein